MSIQKSFWGEDFFLLTGIFVIFGAPLLFGLVYVGYFFFGASGELHDVRVLSRDTYEEPDKVAEGVVFSWKEKFTIWVSGHDKCLQGEVYAGEELKVGDKLKLVRYYDCLGACNCITSYHKE